MRPSRKIAALLIATLGIAGGWLAWRQRVASPTSAPPCPPHLLTWARDRPVVFIGQIESYDGFVLSDNNLGFSAPRLLPAIRFASANELRAFVGWAKLQADMPLELVNAKSEFLAENNLMVEALSPDKKKFVEDLITGRTK